MRVAGINAHCAPRQAVGAYSAARMTAEKKNDSTIRKSSGHESSSLLSNQGKIPNVHALC